MAKYYYMLSSLVITLTLASLFVGISARRHLLQSTQPPVTAFPPIPRTTMPPGLLPQPNVFPPLPNTQTPSLPNPTQQPNINIPSFFPQINIPNFPFNIPINLPFNIPTSIPTIPFFTPPPSK
ncbi:unnamed protein product [Cochlearia groenlandica]